MPRSKPSAAAPTAVPRGLAPAETALVEKLVAVLPPGWSITRTASHVVPEGWISESATGLLVEGRRGADTFRIWFLPRDWIGIRTPDPARRRPNYWEGILAGGEHTTITLSTERAVPERIRQLGMQTPSIVNGGWAEVKRVFRGRFEAAEAAAEHLVAAHCHDRASRDEAAYSLVVLGIPAASVFRRTAVEGTGEGQQFCISALSHFPGAATVATLAAVLGDPATTDKARGYAGQATGDLASAELGPPLVTALGLTRDIDTCDRIILGISGVRYASAGPPVLAAMEAIDSAYYKARFARTLAVLRYAPAVPAIRKLAEESFPRSKEKLSKDMENDLREKARMALRVLTGDWGEPVNGLRFLLEAPGAAAAGKPNSASAGAR